MELKSRPLISAALLILVVMFHYQVSVVMGGSWQPIADLKSPLVLDIAKFALAEYLKVHNDTSLPSFEVIKGESQVVAGVNYKLVISVEQAMELLSGRYEATVWDKPWAKFRKLMSFTKV